MKTRPFVKPIEYVKGGWSSWINKTCKSNCLLDGVGYQRRERRCNNPTPINTDEGCPGRVEFLVELLELKQFYFRL